MAESGEFRPPSDVRDSAAIKVFLIPILALFGVVLRGGYEPPRHRAPAADPMKLVAPAGDPQMAEAIRIAQMPVAGKGNPWSKSPGTGPSATFEIPGGSITLTRSEIAEANFIYPQLKENAKLAHGSSYRPANDGFGGGKHDGSEWGDGEN
ncbi:MAG: hypothetical protein ACKOOL_00920 [Novosphingobium sp.]